MLKFLAVILIVFSVSASAKGRSAHRNPTIDFTEYLSSAKIGADQEGDAGFPSTPQQLAVPLAKLDITTLPKWDKLETAQTGFEMLRDFRFINEDVHPGFLRRDSWLYPDDGCFARAALAKQNLVKWGFSPVKKIFAFGNLKVTTQNSPAGEVTWWYHVVNGISVDNQAYVLDPAIEPLRPLLLSEWVNRMGGENASVTLAICDEGTYVPDDACNKPSVNAENSALSDQMDYLGEEWSQLENMKRDPVKELGLEPPWPLRPAK